MIETYSEFIDELNQRGVMLLSTKTRYPSLAGITRPEAWYAGGERDPWDWKNVLAANCDGAYAHIFAGQGSFVSREFYPVVYAACLRDIDAEYDMGNVSTLAVNMWRLFDERPVWGRHELRRRLCDRFEKRTEFDNAVRTLENAMLITISGQVQPISDSGKPMGWQAMEYRRVDDYLAGWLEGGAELNPATARQMLRERILRNCPELTNAEFKRCFGNI